MKEIEKVDYAVEANDFETLKLWEECAAKLKIGDESICSSTQTKKVSWDAYQKGLCITIGYVEKHPVNVILDWANIDGRKVLFYQACSRMVDYEMVENWIRENCLNPNGTRTNAMNFHIITNEIKLKTKNQTK